MDTEKVDLTPQVDAEFISIKDLKYAEKLERLHLLERQCRVAKDEKSNLRVAEKIANLCIEDQLWKDLGYQMTLLSKRRGAFRQTVTQLVHLSMDSLSQIQNEDDKIELIKEIRDVTEGKIFVEVERAQVTNILVDFIEKNGNLQEAADIMNDLRLEVLTTMELHERTQMMLKQFRLCLDCKDQLRSTIAAEKLKDLNIEDVEQKVEFLTLLIKFHSEFTFDQLETGKCFFEKFKILDDTNDLMEAIFAAVLAPHSAEQVSFWMTLSKLKILSLRENAKNLLDRFMGNELLHFEDVLTFFGDISDEKKKLLKIRVIEHGLRVISKFYTNIKLTRLAELLHLDTDEVEVRIIDLVFTEKFYAKIDRPKGVVTFKKQQKVCEIADTFSDDIASICRLVDQAYSLIEKEKQCIHRPKI